MACLRRCLRHIYLASRKRQPHGAALLTPQLSCCSSLLWPPHYRYAGRVLQRRVVLSQTIGLPNTSVEQLSLRCVWRRLADAASALMLVLTMVPTETVRAVAVTGSSTGELLWASPVGQVARSVGRKWGEATVDLPKARAAPECKRQALT